ncbi:MAG: GEVED domain-containing protein, partial [Rubripirellula sp.]
GVQFRETADQGITFALGDTADLQPRPGIFPISQQVLDARIRIDPTFNESAIVFSNEADFQLAYGEDFLRKAMAGIGLILGLEQTPDLPSQTLMTLDPVFLNDTINPEDPIPSLVDPLDVGEPQRDLRNLEPVFPGNYDTLHGNYLHRSDSIDVDLYRFEVNLGDADRVGTLTAETFSERLANSSLLDTTLTLFQQHNASISTDFGVGTELQVVIESLEEGLLGNNSRIDIIQTDRVGTDNAIRVTRPLDNLGNPVANGILIDMPRLSGLITSVPVGDVVDAINDDPFASSIFRATLVTGAADTDIGATDLNYAPLLLSGGGVTQLSRNDDYFSEDSRVIASLGAGVYYVGVAASGNDHYDPTVPGSSYGGRTQGEYELHLKFEPAVDEVDVIRDLDSDRIDVPGTPLDGDGNGQSGGVSNFWFQTRALNRMINFTEDGAAVTNGQTITVTGGNGVVRTYEFVPLGGTARPGNIAVDYNPGQAGFPTPPSSLASALQSAINSRRNETGVSVGTDGATVIFDGERSISVSSDFRGGDVLGRNIFVDKTAGPQADGSLDQPFNNISNPAVANAFGSALTGDIVRIVGNGGADQDITTEADNFSYQIGVSDTGGQTLEDGRTMEVPQGVTTMIDAGAAFKLRNARIGVGSSSVQLDRSNGALQVLGAPRLVELSLQGQPVKTTIIGDDDADRTGFDDGKVIFTSTRDRAVDAAAAGINPEPSSGNWGGLVFRRDVDQAEGRRDLEDEGIFLQHVNHADLRYGGTSNLLIDSVQQTVNPIQIINLRPTITFNEILFSADAAISAAPNSFEETSFQAPVFQVNGAFTADYSRVGPDIHNNDLIDNSINGVFIRSTTTPVSPAQPVTTSVRFDDTSIVHVVAENLFVEGNPGGSITDGFSPDLSATSGRELSGGALQPADYQYRMTFVDGDGFESLATTAGHAFDITVVRPDSSVELIGLSAVQQADYVSRRLYRADMSAANPVFELIASLDSSSQSFIDDGTSLGGILDLNATGRRGRLDGSLVFDPGLVVKLQGARIELGQGTQFLAEGSEANPVVFTSVLDDRYGAGGTFDTNNDSNLTTPPAQADRGDWSGLYASPTSRISIDNGIIAYAGGVSLIGGKSRGFAPVEIQQADGRITNTRFEFNEAGQDGTGDVGREGRLGITPSTLFVRGATPTIVGNDFIDNRGSIIAIDSDSLIADYVLDKGRSTGSIDRLSNLDDNHGALIRENRYENVPADDDADKQISGLDIRGGELTTESIWDDTDIVHMLQDSIVVGNFHSSGGLLLKSRPEESLVVKLSGAGTPNSPTLGTGFTATGTPGSISDRIGGTVQIVGLPGAPVVLTSFKDDTVGAGLSTRGTQFTDTNGDSFGSRPETNDWRSILLDQYSNDRNVDFILEQELSTAVPPGFNGATENAQVLGELAPSIDEGDDTRRIGFEVEGYLSGPTDVDVYSFVGSPGTEVWIDIDKTLFQLDTVVELLDVSGNLLGRSDNSFAEIAGDEDVLGNGQSNVGTLQEVADEYTDFGVGGLYEDFNSTNPRDAGLRFTLPGTQSSIDSRSVYFFRVRSASVNPDDAAGGLTKGGYRFQVRLSEAQEFSGSVVRFADIRYANHGVHVRGLPGESPLLGDAQENEGVGNGDFFFFSQASGDNDQIDSSSGSFTDISPPGDRPQNLGNLVNNKKNVISVGGRLEFGSDVDFYQVDLDFNLATELYQSTVFDIDYADGGRPDTNLSIFYDPDGEFGPDSPRLVLFGQNANVAEDRTSPLGESDAIERLMRGSSGNGDAFVGPVSLPEGTYYVAITESSSIPDELTDNILVRREPINSIQRLFEDRVNPSQSSTASGPRFPELFTDASIVAGGFVKTTDRGNEAGHGVQQNFDNSNIGQVVPETIYREGFAPIPFDIGDSPFTAFDIDSLDWSIADNNEIGGAFSGGFFGTGTSENTSTVIPHISIDGSMAFDAVDFLEILVPEDGTRVIVDIDRGFNPFQGADDNDDETPIFIPDPDSIDLDLFMVQSTLGGFAFVTPEIVDSDPNDGRAGSAPGDANMDGIADIPLNTVDPFFDGILDAGLYFIGVAADNTAVTIDGNGVISISNNDLPTSGEYRVHVSVENHALPQTGGASGNQSLFFDRAPSTTGTLVSESFDLTGYSADDMPNFYFNYLLDQDFTDIVSYTVTSDQDQVGETFGDLFGDSRWRQNVVSLADFAGHTNVQVTFEYEAGVGVGGEGLYLDDFIVGFAERGETIFNARGGEDGFSFGFGNAGEYQLEVRTATDFASTTGGFFGSSQTLTRDFDTNDRHSQDITIVAPDGSQISDGDTFTISDGSFTQRFEFTTDNVTNFSNVSIAFTAGDSGAVIAQRIRTAINQSSQLDVEAASASGIDTGTLTDNRLNLFGAVNGSFDAVASAQAAPLNLSTDANGDILMPAILHDGVGDENYHRVQSAVIIENNQISDAHAIGVWSEPGDRDVDPEDLREAPSGGFFFPGFGFNDPFAQGPIQTPHPFLQQPPVGNVYPGAVRNLPTLNDSVLGGLAPGVVVRNNTVDQAGLAGIKIEGQTRPFVLDNLDGLDTPIICDGLAMAIDAGGTRVVFEFEDISGAVTSACGSGQIGGDGFTDGHVPIYYRRLDGNAYNDNPTSGRERDYGYSSFELMLSIQQSIQGSILMTNDMAELVTAYIGPSLNTRDEFSEQFARTPESFSTAAVYIEGASNVYFTNVYAKGGGSIPTVSLAPVGEAVQPLARVVNNTVYGADGIESTFVGDPTLENNDLLSEPVITHAGRAHTGPYISNGIIGDNASNLVTPENDVDIYQVDLVVGDRLIVDIDTLANGPDTSIRIFNEFGVPQTLDRLNGIAQTVNQEGTAPQYLDPESSVNNPQNDAGRTAVDPFVDFTALATGTYYIAVSGDGNEAYDPNSLSGRIDGAGGTGDYQIGVEVYAPRQAVLSVNDGNNATTFASALVGTTFTITQIPDFAQGTPNLPGGPNNATTGNQITFQFSTSGARFVNGNVNVALRADYRVPDIMRAIALAVTGFQDIAENVDIPTIPNGENGNGPDGRSGPITRARATALGGQMGDNLGIVNLSARPLSGFLPPLHWLLQNDSDFYTVDSASNHTGFGHDRRENNKVTQRIGATDGIGTTELYVLLENIAEIEISPEAAAAGLKLTPDATKPQFAENSDQLVAEAGVWVTGGASPTLLNNVLSNLHQSILVEETNDLGFGKRVQVFGDEFVKPQQVLAVGNAFQYDEERNNEIRSDGHWILETSLSTDEVIGATNVSDQNDDFNFVIATDQPLFNNPAGNDFLPAGGSLIIDSAINSVDDRDEYVTVKNAVGLPASNVLSPTRDVRGVLRADNPDFATPGSLGFSVFKDRGSNELADFVGPFAIAEIPRDNDAAGVDTDPATSFITLNGGVFDEFRIQLRDTGDESDPFTGFGVDDRTVVVSVIDDLRPSGANVTLFEDDRLLIEGIDYTFNYNSTSDTITLTPLAGIWQSDRSYRIALNNQDRTVLVAPDPSLVNDGDQLSIVDSDGGTLVFEFESGYSLLVPEPITMVVPQVGTNAGGLSDGDIFQINDGSNPIVVFEFNQDDTTLPGTVPVVLPPGQTPTVESDLQAFLEEIANNIGDAIQTQIDAGTLNVDVRVLGTRVVVGAEPGARAVTSLSGLQQLPRTLALQVPSTGVGTGGIQDGDTFVIDNGTRSETFEFDTNNVLNNTTNIRVNVIGVAAATDVALAVQDAVATSGLGLTPAIEGNGLSVYLNLPLDGSASVPQGQLSVVGLSRTANDEDLIVITPNNGDPTITLEVNRTDEPDISGVPMDDGVTVPNVPVNINRATTADELAGLVSNAIKSLPPIAGLSPNDLQVIPGGLLTVGGEEGLGFAVTGTSLEVNGSPSVTGASTIQVFGPLLLGLPLVGGGGIQDGSVVVITDDTGADVIFEFNVSGTQTSVLGSIAVPYDSFSTFDVVADNLVAAINGANIGVTAQNVGAGQVSLGRIDESRVDINGIFDPNNPGNFIPGLSGGTLRRGIVSDGEVMSIRQGSETVTYEFEAAVGGGGVTPGNVPVPFQPGSTVGDVAVSLAATINNNRGNLRVTAEAELDANGDPTGEVLLDDQPGTVIDVTSAPTLNVTGVPGGATPIRISPAFSATEVKLAMISAINSVNQPGELPVTSLSAEDRGGATFFVSNGEIFNGPIQNFALPAITDLAGNPLEANRNDLSTQFTILMPTVGLDFGDAPDPVSGVSGRYPTRNVNNGPRHVVDNELFLGSFIDADVDGVPGVAADGDDLTIAVSNEGVLFDTSVVNGAAEIVINDPIEPLTRDGDTITIDTGVAIATLEFDVNGRFDEDNYAIRPDDPTSIASIAEAILRAIEESPLEPASVSVDGDTVLVNADDEDGVVFISETNPTGVLNHGVSTPIDVSVTGAGVLEAWIDFNADGDWDDPGEKIIPMADNAIFDDLRSELCPVNLVGAASNIFADTGSASTRTFCIVVPPTTPIPPEAVSTYARFRVSREGGLGPEGLALSGEVEDYAITLLPGNAPQINEPNRSYTVEEDRPLQALDAEGV